MSTVVQFPPQLRLVDDAGEPTQAVGVLLLLRSASGRTELRAHVAVAWCDLCEMRMPVDHAARGGHLLPAS